MLSGPRRAMTAGRVTSYPLDPFIRANRSQSWGSRGMKWNVRSWWAGPTHHSAIPKTPDRERLMAHVAGEEQNPTEFGPGAADGISAAGHQQRFLKRHIVEVIP